MTIESKFFIQILSDYISRKKTMSVHDLNWNELVHLSRVHQVEGIIYYQCRDFLPERIRSAFEQSFAATLFIYAKRKAVLKEVSEALIEQGIHFCTVKGYGVASFYPVPYLRTMGDCDIVLKAIDMSSAVNVMRRLGFQGDESTAVQQWSCDRDKMHFELHSCMIHYTDHTDHRQEVFFNNFDVYMTAGNLDWSFHFLFLLMHLRKHFLAQGVGFRQFMDLAIIIKYCKELNWDWIEDRLKYLKLERFAGACFSLIDFMFHVEAPIEYKRLKPEFRDQVIDQVIKNGVFGYDDPKNNDNSARTDLVIGRRPLIFSRIYTLLKAVFIEYNVLRGYPGITYLNGRPYLILIAWIHRWIILLKRSNKSSIVRTIKRSFIPRHELNAREKILKGMGI